eukprot:s1710_g13.t1
MRLFQPVIALKLAKSPSRTLRLIPSLDPLPVTRGCSTELGPRAWDREGRTWGHPRRLKRVTLALAAFASAKSGKRFRLWSSIVFQHVMDSADIDPPPEEFWELRRKHPQLPLALSQLLKRSFTRCSSRVVDFFPGEQGGKMLVELQDGQRIETVLIEHAGPKPRSTVCVSSQIGCKMGCRFCATGTMGLRGQLSAGEILEQLFHAKRWARKEAPVRNVVFMGMGEPLDNYENVMAAVKVMPEHAFGVALKNVTISTVGVPGRIRALAHEIPATGPNLALSLHAPTQDLRIDLVPTARGLVLEDLMREVDDYGEVTGNKAATMMDAHGYLKILC